MQIEWKTPFTDAERFCLTHPERWRLVGPYWNVNAVSSMRHAQWSRAHTRVLPHLEMILVLQGRGLYGINGRHYPYRPGAILVFPPYVPHDRDFAPWHGPLSRLWLSFPRDLAINCYRYQPAEPEPFSREFFFYALAEVGLNRRLVLQAGSLRENRVDMSAGLRVWSMASAVVAALLQPQPVVGEANIRARQRQKIEAICRYLETYAGRRIALSHLCERFEISQTHLVRLFKQQTGHTVHQFIDRCRMWKLTALARDETPRKVMAEKLGFSSAAALSRWIRRQSGEGPLPPPFTEG